jgi:hypothetical protein
MKSTEYVSKKPLSWATADQAQNPYPYNNRDEYVLLNCNIKDIFNNTHQDIALDVTDPIGGPNAFSYRLPKAIQHFQANQPMDYAIVGYNPYTKQVDFTNGRHRLAAAYQLGHEYVPVMVNADHLDKFKRLVRTKD